MRCVEREHLCPYACRLPLTVAYCTWTGWLSLSSTKTVRCYHVSSPPSDVRVAFLIENSSQAGYAPTSFANAGLLTCTLGTHATVINTESPLRWELYIMTDFALNSWSSYDPLLPADLGYSVGSVTVTSLAVGLHQIVVEYFNSGGSGQLSLTIMDSGGADVSTNFEYDPACGCYGDCASCDALGTCQTCVDPNAAPAGGVCPSSYAVPQANDDLS